MLRSVSVLFGAVIAVNLLGLTSPEPPQLALTVTDRQEQPIEGLWLDVKGASGSGRTDSKGEVRLALRGVHATSGGVMNDSVLYAQIFGVRGQFGAYNTRKRP